MADLRTWTKKFFRQALTDLAVEHDGNASNSALDKVLSDTLKERNPKAKVEELQVIRDNLFDQTAVRLDGGSAPADKKEVKSDCPTFGKGYKASSPECKTCADKAKVEYDACVALTAQVASTASTRRVAKPKEFGKNTRAKYDDYAELVKHLRSFKGEPPTGTLSMDLETLKEASLTVLVKRMAVHNERLTALGIQSNDFLKEGRIKTHIKFREARGWEYTWNGPKVKLTGYTKPGSVAATKLAA